MARHILIIDDDRETRNFLTQAFNAAGFNAESVDRGATGLRKLLSEDYDLVLVDYNMAEISGPKICQALRKHDKTREIPVIMTSAAPLSADQSKEVVAAYGNCEFLSRPFTGPALQTLLERIFLAADGRQASGPRPIADYTIPLQLHRLYVEKATGLLHLQHGQAKKVVYIKDGYPIFTRSNVLSECLGRMLVREGVLSELDCDQSVDLSRERGRLQGTVLIEMGVLTPQDLHEALTRQVTEKLLATFAWKEGTWQFVPGKDFKKSITRIKLTPATLILQGITRFWSAKQLDDFLYPYGREYLKQTGNPHYRFQEINLNKRGEAVFRECRGVKTLNEIVDGHPLARREVQQILTALLISEMLDHQPTAEASAIQDSLGGSEPKVINESLRRKILEEYRRIMDSDYFGALMVSRRSEEDEIKKAYHRLAKEYHPDRFLGTELSNEMRTKINEMFQYLTQAYTVLNNRKTRADYLNKLDGKGHRRVDINRVVEAESAYQEGLAYLKINSFTKAAEAFRKAAELSPEEPEYKTYFAWALYKSDPENQAKQTRAADLLQLSREANPGLDLTHLYLGKIYLVQGKERLAEKAFEMAVQANPDCAEALRELRLMLLRREQQGGNKDSHSWDLFGRFRK